MCEKEKDPVDLGFYSTNAQQTIASGQAKESHMVYELKQRREYLLKQLLDIQKAIDAVSKVSTLY